MQAKLIVLIAGAITAFTSCDRRDEPNGARLELTIAPLVLPGVVDVCYSLTVYNAAAMGAGDTIWSEPHVCSTTYGNSAGGDVAFVGTCDADTPAPLDDLNYVRLTLDTIEVAPGQGSLPSGTLNLLDDQTTVATSGDGDADFENPCPAPAGCVLPVACVANADARVAFDLTVMADASQGFFDLAVTFEDIFCSGKYDTCYDTTPGSERWIELLHGDDTTRDHTGVLALACAVGPDGDADLTTTMLYSEVALTCSNGASTLPPFTLPLALAGGEHDVTVDWGAPIGAAPLQYATYFGNEALACGADLSCNKSYFNVAIDLDDIPAGWSCALAAQATATTGDGPLTNGTLTAAGTSYPFIDYRIDDVAACQQNALDGDDSAVATRYATTFFGSSNTLKACFSYDGAGTPVAIPGACSDTTTLSTPNVLAAGFVGTPLTISATFAFAGQPLAGQLVTFELSGPGSNTQQATTDASGVATASFTPSNPGAHTVSAHFDGTPTYPAAASSATNVAVYQPTHLELAPASGNAGAPLTLSATLATVGGVGIAGQTVVFSFDDGAPDQSATTDASGVASVDVTFASAGSYTATGSFANAAAFFCDETRAFPPIAETAVASVTVEGGAPTALSTPSVPELAMVGGSLTVSATLTRTSLPTGPLAGELVTFTLDGPAGQVELSGTTNDAGLATVTFTPSARGAHTVSASFDGDGGLEPAMSGSAGLQVYQRTKLTLTPVASVTSGTATTVRATLTALPDGTPVQGQSVTFTFGGGAAQQSALTSSDGKATVSVTFANAGSYMVTATYNPSAGYLDETGAFPPVPEVDSLLVSVFDALTTLTTPSVATDVMIGNALPVSATLVRTTPPSGALGGQSVSFTLSGPAGSDVQTTITDAAGNAFVTFTPATRGAHSVVAQFAGGTGLQAATSSGANVNVVQRAWLFLATSNGVAGDPIAVSASLTTFPGDVGIAGQTVTFDFAGVIGDRTAVTDDDGVAMVTVTFPSPGTFTADASSAGAFITDPAATLPPLPLTSSATVNVAAVATDLTTPSVAPFALVGDELSVSSTLNRLTPPAGALANQPVSFALTGPGGTSTLTEPTNAAGAALVTFTPTTRGVHVVSATFAGDSASQPASNSTALTIYQRTSLELGPATGAVGAPVAVSATLAALPSGAGVAGQTVTFSFDSGAQTRTATTDAAGVATVSVTFGSSGSHPVTASFQSAADFFANSAGSFPVQPTTNTGSVTVNP